MKQLRNQSKSRLKSRFCAVYTHHCSFRVQHDAQMRSAKPRCHHPARSEISFDFLRLLCFFQFRVCLSHHPKMNGSKKLVPPMTVFCEIWRFHQSTRSNPEKGISGCFIATMMRTSLICRRSKQSIWSAGTGLHRLFIIHRTMNSFGLQLGKQFWAACQQHQRREIIAIVALENGAFCTVFCENFHKF